MDQQTETETQQTTTTSKAKAPKKAADAGGTRGSIPAPKFQIVTFTITGSAPYVANKFSQEARDMMQAKQEEGSQAQKGKKREPKNFEAGYLGAMHSMADGSHGIPCTAFRQAMISACRLVGFKMTLAKLALFVLPDGQDSDDGAPLVRITRGTPRRTDDYVLNETGVADIRPRPRWDAGWQAVVRVRYDSDIFSDLDVENLMMRVGVQVGVGAGRPDSKSSAGQDWGTFTVERTAERAGLKVA